MDHFENAVRLGKERVKLEILDDQKLPNGKWKNADKAEIKLIVLQGGGEFWFEWMMNKYGDYVDGKFKWCGFFVGSCFPTLAPSIRLELISSCYRIVNDWGETEFARPEFVKPENIRPGDIVTVNGTRQNSHMTLATSTVSEDGDFETVEGNSYGYTPFWTKERCSSFGRKYRKGVESVNEQTRNTDDVFRVIRLTPEMLNG